MQSIWGVWFDHIVKDSGHAYPFWFKKYPPGQIRSLTSTSIRPWISYGKKQSILPWTLCVPHLTQGFLYSSSSEPSWALAFWGKYMTAMRQAALRQAYHVTLFSLQVTITLMHTHEGLSCSSPAPSLLKFPPAGLLSRYQLLQPSALFSAVVSDDEEIAAWSASAIMHTMAWKLMKEGSMTRIGPFLFPAKMESSSVLTDIGLVRWAERFQLIQGPLCVFHVQNNVKYTASVHDNLFQLTQDSTYRVSNQGTTHSTRCYWIQKTDI